MIHTIWAIIFILYLEIFGRTVMMKFFARNTNFGFAYGFAFFILPFYLVGWTISVFRLSFYYYLFLFICVFLLSFILIIRNVNKIKITLNKYHLLCAVIVVIQLFVASNKTLGHLDGFDTTYYLNLMDHNVASKSMYTTHPYFGNLISSEIFGTYIFQSYYTILSVVVYINKGLFNLININVDTLPLLIWGCQLVLNYLFVSVIFEILEKLHIKSKSIIFLAITIGCFYIGSEYYHQLFAFIGNSFRLILLSLSSLYIYMFAIDNDEKDLYIVFILLLANCAFSSTGCFILLFSAFSIFIAFKLSVKSLLILGLTCIIPLLNILYSQTGNIFNNLIILFIFTVILFLLKKTIYRINNNFKLCNLILILLIIFMIALSFVKIESFTEMSNFPNYTYTSADMIINYFGYYNLGDFLFKISILLLIGIYIIFNYKNKYIQYLLILLITVFNPIFSPLMHNIILVFHRGYDLVINIFIIVLALNWAYNNLSYTFFKRGLACFYFMFAVFFSFNHTLKYYNNSFAPSQNFDKINKMSYSEKEIIDAIRTVVIYNEKILQPKIISPLLLLDSYLDRGEFMFGRSFSINPNLTENDKQLADIFFPADIGYEVLRPENPNILDINELLINSEYDLLVIKRTMWIYDPFSKTMKSLVHIVEDNTNLIASDYSTADYAMFLLQ